MKLSLSEMERLCGIPAGTLRYYDRENILPLFQRSASGHRYVDMADVSTIQLLNMLKMAGCPLSLISEIIALAEGIKSEPCEIGNNHRQISALLDKNTNTLLENIAKLSMQVQISRYIAWFFSAAAEESTAVHCSDDAPSYDAELPLEFRIYLEKIGCKDAKNREILRHTLQWNQEPFDRKEYIQAFRDKYPDYMFPDNFI